MKNLKISKTWIATGGVFLIFSTSLASSAPADDKRFLIQPYLFSILGKQIGVAWQYASPPKEVPSITFTNTDNNGYENDFELEAQQDGDLYFSILPIPACGFGTQATYQVTEQLAPITIQEIPCSNSPDPVRFSFMADTQEGYDHDFQFAQQIAGFPSQAVLNGGDLVQNGTYPEDWVGFFQSMEPVGGTRVLFPAVGNHEYRGDTSVPMWKHFFRYPAKDAHYSYDLGAAHVIVLNSNFVDDPSQRLSQLPWLEAELAKPSRWKIIYFHHPGYSVGFFNNPEAPRKEFKTIQKRYIPLFEKYGVDLVMNGHVHLFETALKNGVHYLIVGPAGGKMGVYGNVDPYRLKSKDVRSIVNLEVSPNHLRALSMAIDGAILDDLFLTK